MERVQPSAPLGVSSISPPIFAEIISDNASPDPARTQNGRSSWPQSFDEIVDNANRVRSGVKSIPGLSDRDATDSTCSISLSPITRSKNAAILDGIFTTPIKHVVLDADNVDGHGVWSFLAHFVL